MFRRRRPPTLDSAPRYAPPPADWDWPARKPLVPPLPSFPILTERQSLPQSFDELVYRARLR